MPPEPKKKKRASGGGSMFVRKTHNKKAGKRQGYAERRTECIEIAWRCKIDGYSERETCKIVQQELGLVDPPDYTTVNRWVNDALKEKAETIANLRDRFVTTEMFRLQRLMRKWMPLATAPDLHVTRTEKSEGQVISVVDENGLKEQAKAAELVLKTIETARRILGVGLANSEPGDEGPKATFTQINALIMNTVGAGVANQTLPGTRMLLGTGDAEEGI